MEDVPNARASGLRAVVTCPGKCTLGTLLALCFPPVMATRTGPSVADASADEAICKRVMKSYFEAHGFVRHQIESFDHFIDVLLHRIVTENSDIEVKTDDKTHTLQFGRVCVPKPTTRESTGFVRQVRGPAEAMARNLTYSSAVLVDVTHRITDMNGNVLQNDVYREVVLCKLPIMVGCRYCYLSSCAADMSSCIFDTGGYFVVNGLEKSIIAQQKLRTNATFVWPGRGPRRVLTAEVRSCHETKLRSTSTLCLHLIETDVDHPAHIIVQLPFIEVTLPITWLFTMLGCESIDEMVAACVGSISDATDAVYRAAWEALNYEPVAMTRQEVFDDVGKRGTTEPTYERQQRYLAHIMSNEVLPHMGLSDDPETTRTKVMYLGHMVHRLMLVYTGKRQCDDRDDYQNKRLDAPGQLMTLQMRQLFRAYLKGLQTQFSRAITTPHRQVNIPKLIEGRKITAGFKFAMSTGNWGVQARLSTSQSGVVQVLNRNSITAALADKRRVSLPANRDSKNSEIRHLHTSAWGIICPAESPEGASCGLVMNIAMMAHVRINSCTQSDVQSLLQSMATETDFRPAYHIDANGLSVRVFHNGTLRGFVPTHRRDNLCRALRRAREHNHLPFDTSISFVADGNEVHIGTDAGCLCRPVINIQRMDMLRRLVAKYRQPSAMLWHDLINHGVVMYVDKDEEREMRIAVSAWETAPGDTHCEVHPTAMFGITANMIPFPDHNQAPRNTYQCAMGKQAIGVHASNHNARFDAVALSLWYPQRPLVSTWVEDVLGTSHCPSGTNLIIAIMSYGGYNQEDSMIFNAGSLQRGLCRCSVARTVRDELPTTDMEFCRPAAECSGRRAASYEHLQDDGTVAVGTRVSNGDVVLGRVRRADAKQRTEAQDFSTVVRCTDEAEVDRVMYTYNKDGMELRKVRVREERIPEVGDKFTSRAGQKGVCGAVLPESDMPFTECGMRPDIIMNPHALPSRMTIGQLLEGLLSTLGCHYGRIGDGSAFGATTIEEIGDALEAVGMNRHGQWKMFNGTTGQPMDTTVYITPTFEQSLKHQVRDKVHARAARGPVDPKTRQPTEGRRWEGGLRFGEMERDCLLGHGTSVLMRERLFTQSDPYEVWVCASCGLLAEGPSNGRRQRGAMCRRCDSSDHVRRLPMPFATKLFMQELAAMNVVARLELK